MHWLDRAYCLLPHRPLFEAGWGDTALVNAVRSAVVEETIPSLEPRFTSDRLERGLIVRDGTFPSPDVRLQSPAHVRLLLPSKRAPRAVCVFFGSWGENGYALRTPIVEPLVREGIAMLLPETPYFGLRGSGVNVVSEFAVMGLALVSEGRGLVKWARDAFGVSVGVAGYSMGGQIAAIVGASLRESLPIAALAPAATAAPIFTEGLISKRVAFGALHVDADEGRRALRALLERFSVLSLPPPVDLKCTVVVGARSDAIVPAWSVRQLLEHWKGCDERWIEGGHVSAVVFDRKALRDAIRDAFAP